MNPDATLAKLLEGWLDGGLPDDEQADLVQLLREDQELRRRFAAQVATLGATRAAADANPRWLALFDVIETHGGAAVDDQSFEAATMGRIEAAGRPQATPAHRAAWAIAAAVVLALTAVFLMNPRPGAPPVAGPPVENGPTAGEAPAARSAAVAVVIAGSGQAAAIPGTYLKPGVISQHEGWISLQTLEGVSVNLEAPFEVTLTPEPDRIHLKSGIARVRVTRRHEHADAGERKALTELLAKYKSTRREEDDDE